MKNIMAIVVSVFLLTGCEALKKAGNDIMAGIVKTQEVPNLNTNRASKSKNIRAVVVLRYGEPEPDYTTYDRGVAYAINGEFIKAQSEFLKIKRTDRLYESAKGSRAVIQEVISNKELKDITILFFKADAHLHKKQYRLGIKVLDKAIKLNPLYAKSYYHQGKLYYFNSQKSRALNNYTKAIELDPKYSEAFYMRGAIYKTDKKIDLALIEFGKSILLSNDSFAYLSRSEIYIDLGKYSEAMDDAKMARKVDPNNPIAHNLLGYINVHQKNKAQACENYRKSCKLGNCMGLEEKQESGYCS